MSETQNKSWTRALVIELDSPDVSGFTHVASSISMPTNEMTPLKQFEVAVEAAGHLIGDRRIKSVHLTDPVREIIVEAMP